MRVEKNPQFLNPTPDEPKQNSPSLFKKITHTVLKIFHLQKEEGSLTPEEHHNKQTHDFHNR
jgi:hypothetical protein